MLERTHVQYFRTVRGNRRVAIPAEPYLERIPNFSLGVYGVYGEHPAFGGKSCLEPYPVGDFARQ